MQPSEKPNPPQCSERKICVQVPTHTWPAMLGPRSGLGLGQSVVTQPSIPLCGPVLSWGLVDVVSSPCFALDM